MNFVTKLSLTSFRGCGRLNLTSAGCICRNTIYGRLRKDMQSKCSMRKPNDASLALRWIKPLADEWLNGFTLFHSWVSFSDVSTETSQQRLPGLFGPDSLHSCRDSSVDSGQLLTHHGPDIRSTTFFRWSPRSPGKGHQRRSLRKLFCFIQPHRLSPFVALRHAA